MVIPALNEQRSLPLVLRELPPNWVDEVLVVDNGSTDATAQVARDLGAEVILEPQRGYGAACLAGLEALSRKAVAPEIVVFLDADFSDFPNELPSLLAPLLLGQADLVIGSRTLGCRDPGALLPQALWGNRLACGLMRIFFGVRHTDLGPFRAIRWEALRSLSMRDTNFGWTVEMQIKAVRRGLKVTEVPVSYRRRVGHSKITGTVRGTLLAGTKILYLIAKYGLWESSSPAPEHAAT